MARPKKLKPDYCHDKASGRAYVRINGQKKYLGDYGTQTSRDEYDRLVGEWIAAGRTAPVTSAVDDDGITVTTLVAAFWDHVQRYYRKPDGTPTSEVDNMRQALRPLRRFYGEKSAKKFGPLALAALQQKMIELGWARTFINRQTNRVRMRFKWGVSKEMILSAVYEALRTVPALSAGRSGARETEPVKPVDEAHAMAIFSFLSPQVQAMVELQALTGMRPGEACMMRGCDITTPKDKTWTYTPAMHKTAHHGHTRVIDLGPRAREIVSKFLKPDLSQYLFSPADAERARREALAAARKTPPSCGNVAGSNRLDGPPRKLGAPYTVAAYRRAIQRACDRAFPPPSRLARLRVPASGRPRSRQCGLIRRETIHTQSRRWRHDRRPYQMAEGEAHEAVPRLRAPRLVRLHQRRRGRSLHAHSERPNDQQQADWRVRRLPPQPDRRDRVQGRAARSAGAPA